MRTRMKIVAALALLSLAGAALAVSTTSFAAEKMSTASGRVAPSDLAVTDIESLLRGKNRVDLVLTIANGDTTSAHAASLTVQALDLAGNLLEERTFATPSIGAGETWSTTVTFSARDLSAAYAESYVIVKQTA